MTNWLWLFLAFYILVGQPALLGRMLDNYSLYQLAWLNAGIFFIAWIISAMCKSAKKKTKTESITSQLLWENVENDPASWVSVVKVQETTVKEIEVAKVDVKPELPESEEAPAKDTAEKVAEDDKEEPKEETKEENKEEKKEEKTSEKPMRESVSIPKIVQPLSWHQTPKKRKKELARGQWLVLLLTLGVAAVIAWTLREFLGNRWIAIALFLWWILYLVIGKLFDINGFYNAKKLFTNWLYIILIIAWIGYGVYATQDHASLNLIKDNAVSYIQDRFKSDKEDNSEVNTWDIIYVFEWTGEVISDFEDNNEILNETWVIENEVENTDVETWIVENVEPVVEAQPEVTQPEVAKSGNPEREVTRWEAIKYLLQWYPLSTKTNKTFTYVSKTNELYPYFKTAQEKAMIWTDVNPSKRISCETYMSLKWILEWWNVNIYDKSQTRIIYWNKANELGKTKGCERWEFVKEKNL
jgi:hypothetical protein